MSPDPKRCPRCGSARLDLKGHCPGCLVAIALTPHGPGTDPLGSEAAEESLPRAFGDYLLESRIASGGMGIVYRARQLTLNRVVALKMLLGGGFAGPEALKRFRIEAAAAARLRHPNLVTIHEVGEHEGLPYFSMEYVEGRDLAAWISTQNTAPEQCARWLLATAEAVDHAHRHGILHRDLKPSNIIIDPFNQPRVTDFGLAMETGSDSHLTLTGQAVGSPSYMPPEQASASHAGMGPHSDVYALGAVLYHLLTGRPPFVGDSIASILTQVQTAEPIPPRRLNPTVPEDLQTLCLKCLEKAPSKRYPTAMALAEDLRRFLRREPILARPLSPAGRLARWSARRPAVAALIVVLILTVALGIGGILLQWRHAESARRLAAANAEVAQRNDYASDMLAASAAIERGQLAEARIRIQRHREPLAGNDLRGFEWHLLERQSRGQALAELSGHSSTVTGVAASPDGRWFVSSGMDHNLLWWDASQRKEVFRHGLGGVGWFVAFTPDSQRVITSWGENEIAVLERNSAKPVRLLPGRLGSLATTAPWIAVSSGSPWYFEAAGDIRIWDYETGSMLEQLPLQGHWVASSADGQRIAVGMDSRRIVVWNRGSRRIEREITTTKPAWCLRFSPDSRHLAATLSDKSLELWDLSNARNPGDGQPEPVAAEPSPRERKSRSKANSLMEEGHWLRAWSLEFSPDGRHLVSTSSDRSVRLWTVPDLRPAGIWLGHFDEVWCSTFSPDSHQIITGGKDGRVMVWDRSQKPAAELPANASWDSPVFAPDGRSLLTGVGTPQGWIHRQTDLAGRTVAEFRDFRRYKAFAPDGGTLLAQPDEDGRIAVRSSVDLTEFAPIQLEGFRAFGLPTTYGSGFNTRGDTYFAVNGKGEIGVWELPSGIRRRTARTQRNTLNLACSAISPRGDKLALSLNFPYEVDLINLGGTGGEARLTGHTEFVKGVAFSADGSLLATAGVDAKIRIWNTQSARETALLAGHFQEVSDLAFAPDGRTLASVEGGTVLKLWRLDSMREVVSMTDPNWGWKLAFSADGRSLAVTCAGKGIELLTTTMPR